MQKYLNQKKVKMKVIIYKIKIKQFFYLLKI